MATAAPQRAAAPVIPLPRLPVILGGLFLAFTAGALIARSAPMGFGFALALVYAPLVLVNLQAGIAVWIAIAHISRLEFVSIGPNAAMLLIVIGWAGALAARRGLPSAWAGPARGIPVALGLLLAWLSLSMVWAREPALAGEKVWEQLVAAAAFVVVATSLRSRRDIQFVLLGFIAGAVLSVGIGLAANGLQGGSSAYETATSTEGRLQGGAGDPNFLAAGVIPALIFALGLFAVMRDPFVRLGLATSVAILTFGLFATQSRGGLVAAAVALLGALAVMRGRRGPLVATILVIGSVGVGWAAANPSAVERLTTSDQGGNGRSELWTVAVRMATDRPVLGVGLNNYREYSRDYTRDVGTLRFVRLIAEDPHVVHNTYLQLLAETGVPGLALLLLVAGLILRTMRRASQRLRAIGERELSLLADCAFISLLSVLASSFFISNLSDWRSWFVAGLGPAFWLLARQRTSQLGLTGSHARA